jgi:hypothetical protein
MALVLVTPPLFGTITVVKARTFGSKFDDPGRHDGEGKMPLRQA